MHTEAREWVEQWAQHVPMGAGVIEVGSCDRNGTIRNLFGHAGQYLGIDRDDGPGVDVVTDAVGYIPPWAPHAVVSTETLEHVNNWYAVVDQMARWLRPDGILVLTCAGPGRKPHAADGSPGGPKFGEVYRNVDPVDLAAMLRVRYRHTLVQLVRDGMDVQAVAWK